MRVYTQKQDSTCFIVAMANCYSYLGLKQDRNFQNHISDLKQECKGGPFLRKQQGIKELGLDKYLNETDHATDLQVTGGIVSIMHPVFNLHACFVSKVDLKDCLVYNSWLGPSGTRMSWRELFRFCRHTSSTHWYFKYAPSLNLPTIKQQEDMA